MRLGLLISTLQAGDLVIVPRNGRPLLRATGAGGRVGRPGKWSGEPRKTGKLLRLLVALKTQRRNKK